MGKELVDFFNFTRFAKSHTWIAVSPEQRGFDALPPLRREDVLVHPLRVVVSSSGDSADHEQGVVGGHHGRNLDVVEAGLQFGRLRTTIYILFTDVRTSGHS